MYAGKPAESSGDEEAAPTVPARPPGRRRVGAVASGMGARRAELENTLAMAVLTSGASGNGPTLADGTQLIATARGNLATTPSAPSVAEIGKGVSALLKAKSAAGTTLNTVAGTLLVGADNVSATQVLVGTMGQPAPLRVVGDASLGIAWYVIAADPNMYPLRLGTLGDSPRVRVRRRWETDGVQVLFGHDFGVAAVEWRGVYKNAGA